MATEYHNSYSYVMVCGFIKWLLIEKLKQKVSLHVMLWSGGLCIGVSGLTSHDWSSKGSIT